MSAQTAEPLVPPVQPPPAVLVVETNAPGATLWLGEDPLGPATGAPYVVPAGVHSLRLVERDASAWRPRTATADVAALPGDTLRVRLDLPYRYRIETLPFGARVRLEGEGGDWDLGTTPLEWESDVPLAGDLLLEAPGYTPIRQRLGVELDTVLLLRLVPLHEPEPVVRITTRPERGFGWVDAAALGVSVAAAAVAVHYKQEADRRFEVYARSGDPDLRPEIHAFDRVSAVALGISAAGLGTFAIRLALR